MSLDPYLRFDCSHSYFQRPAALHQHPNPQTGTFLEPGCHLSKMTSAKLEVDPGGSRSMVHRLLQDKRGPLGPVLRSGGEQEQPFWLAVFFVMGRGRALMYAAAPRACQCTPPRPVGWPASVYPPSIDKSVTQLAQIAIAEAAHIFIRRYVPSQHLLHCQVATRERTQNCLKYKGD